MKSLTPIAVALILATTAATARQNRHLRRMDLEARYRDVAVERRGPRDIIGQIIGDNNSSSTTQTSTTEISPPFEDNTSTSTSTTHTDPLPPSSTSTPDQNVNNTPTTTTSTTSTSSTSSTTTSTSSTSQAAVVQTRLSTDTYQGTTLYAGSGNLSNLRASQTPTSTSDAPTSTSSPTSFFGNKSAVAATFTILGIVALGGIVFVGFWFYKKSKRGGLNEEDMWDEASMKEFHHPPGITPPSAAVLADDGYGAAAGGLGRKNTVLPSQSAGAAGGLARTKSNHSSPRREIETDEEPDEILQMPPVTNYDRPRDSAYDIVPAAPPPTSYVTHGGGYGYNNAYASGSGAGSSGLHPPHRAGDHSSFGSGIGNDPFAGTGFVDATRESAFGPGQAGRGAGYQAAGSSSQAQVGMGNQWPQGYNQAYGYSGGSQSPYGAGYGYAQ